MKKIYFLVFLWLTCFVSPVKSQTNPADKWIADTFFVDSLFVEYRLFVPENYDSTVNYPFILVYGGVGDNTEPYFAHFDLAGTWISFADSVNQKNNPCFILVPALPQSGEWWWEPAVDIPVNALFASLLKEYSIDQNRVYLTGFSLGGLQTYIGLEYVTDLLAAAIPICGNYGEADKVKIFKDVPNWTFHGQDDGTVKVSNSRVVMEEYEKLNSKVIYTNSKYRLEINLSDDQIKNHILAHSNPFYTEYPGVGHDSWTQAYEYSIIAAMAF
jgi:predicted peptidase